jgi:hypothetical protein
MEAKQRREHRIAALERMGYEVRFETWWDGDVDGYVVYDPSDERISDFPMPYVGDAWDDFLECIDDG